MITCSCLFFNHPSITAVLLSFIYAVVELNGVFIVTDQFSTATYYTEAFSKVHKHSKQFTTETKQKLFT